MLLPICEEHAAQCLAHCLSLSLVTMKEVLKYVFNISETNMRKTQASELITNALLSTQIVIVLIIYLIPDFLET
jgi:hypothetical protein